MLLKKLIDKFHADSPQQKESNVNKWFTKEDYIGFFLSFLIGAIVGFI